MIHSNDESRLSEAFTAFTNPFSLAARFTMFFKSPAKVTRYIENRRSIISRVSKSKRSFSPVSRVTNNHSSLIAIPIKILKRIHISLIL